MQLKFSCFALLVYPNLIISCKFEFRWIPPSFLPTAISTSTMSAAHAAGAAASKYLQKKAAFVQDDLLLPPHYSALLEVQNQWFRSRHYSDKMDLLRDAAAGPGDAQDFARYFLALRHNIRTRIPFAQFCTDVQNDGKDEKGRMRSYWRALSNRLWEHYQTAHRMVPNSGAFFCNEIIFLPTSVEIFLSKSVEKFLYF